MWPILGDFIPVLLAFSIDRLFRDLPNRFHTIDLFGFALDWILAWAPKPERVFLRFLYGALVTLAGITIVGSIGLLLQTFFALLPWPIEWIAKAIVLKMTLSLYNMALATKEVFKTLKAQDVPRARTLVRYYAVDQDTARLNAYELSSVTVGEVAKNASDGIVAPLLYYALGGLPAALAYCFIDAADAMMGHHDDLYEWLGKIPALLDDLVNLIPARLAAWALIVAALFSGANVHNACLVWWHEARLSDSLNAGYPMSSMAGALEIEIEQFGHYRLGAGYRHAEPGDIPRAVRLLYAATTLTVIGLFFLITFIHLVQP
jgi:adenosylcobinamide-phosphate synthase